MNLGGRGGAGGADDDVNEGSAAVAASTIAAKLSPSCEESNGLGFGVGT